jgi:hypothetical protein
MDEFLLIMRHEDGSKIASPEQMQRMDETNYGLDRRDSSTKLNL